MISFGLLLGILFLGACEKNVDNDDLAVARGKQRNINGWQRPTKNS